MTLKQSSAVHIQALIWADGILPGFCWVTSVLNYKSSIGSGRTVGQFPNTKPRPLVASKMTHLNLQIINSNLCLVDENTGTIIKEHKPLFNRIAEFKQVNDLIILQEGNLENLDQSNIYCIDKDLNLVWTSELPYPDDTYPNRIIWDSEIDPDAGTWDKAYLDNSNLFTTSSIKGFTVSISYLTGKIVKTVFTR